MLLLILFSFVKKCLSAQGHHGLADDSNFSALDEEDLQTVTIENKLGCDIYLKKAEQDSNAVGLLHHDDYASLWIPPPRYTDRLNVAETREARRYVAVQIIKAKVTIFSFRCQLTYLLLPLKRNINFSTFTGFTYC